MARKRYSKLQLFLIRDITKWTKTTAVYLRDDLHDLKIHNHLAMSRENLINYLFYTQNK